MQKIKIQTGINILCVMVGILFTLFFIYIGIFENNATYQTREMSSCIKVENITERKISDSKAPIGYKKEYQWELENIDESTGCLSFYLIHQYAEVYLGDELVYRLMPQKSNTICKSVSSNWIIVPLYASDNGKEIRVITTPVYECIADRKPDFMIGSYAATFMGQLKHDFPQLFLGLVCLLLGLIQFTFFIYVKENNLDIMYLSLLSVLLGIWKITDTRISPIVLPDNTMILGYLSLGVLFLSNLPALLFARYRTSDPKSIRVINFGIAAACVATACAILCQITGILELREMIAVSHLMLIVSMFVIGYSMTISHQQKASGVHTKTPIWFALLLGCGCSVDIIVYYIYRSSANIFATMITFIIYSVIIFITSVKNSNIKAYTDAQTGLSNKRRCNEIINDKSGITEPMGIMMFDLNSLKHINDTFGHDAGDHMIYDFARILKNTIPQNNVICRWGGDEFAIIVADANPIKMNYYLFSIQKAVDDYNAASPKNMIYYAAGYALSTEFEDFTRRQLFEKADEFMYRNKKKWYEARPELAR